MKQLRAGFLLGILTLPLVAQAAKEADDPALAPTLREALLRLALRFDPGAETGPVRAQLDVYALELKERLAAAPDATTKARTVADYFFKTPLLAPAQDLADPENFYVHKVLAGRQGFCLALSAIVLATGEKLGLPLHGVAAPRHFFVRWDDGTTRVNIETLEGGASRSDDSYRLRGIPKDAEDEGLYLKNLDRRAVIAHLLNNEGYILWRRGESAPAEKRFHEALALHPALVEAGLNLGVVAAERGDMAEADARFAKVLRFLPKDAPTLFNRALAALRAEQFEAALDGIEDAVRLDPKSPHLLHYRDIVLATVLRPGSWERYQADVVARGEKLRRDQLLAPGLAGAYFAKPDLSGPAKKRTDPEVRFEWRFNAPMNGLPSDRFSVRWAGFIDLPDDGIWSFFTVVNDGVRVWIDGVRIIDNWKDNEGALDKESLRLKKGLHRLRIEYFDSDRFAGIDFQVKRSDAQRALGPSSFLRIR